MRSPLLVAATLSALGATLALATPANAEPPDSRFGVLPLVGTGIAGLTAPGALPGFIGYSTLGGELFGQLRTWGLFLRFDFLSSGDVSSSAVPAPAAGVKQSSFAGWNAFSVDAGVSYRLFGDSKTLALFARGALTYEHWIGDEKTPCPLLPFVPNGCNTEGASQIGFSGDALGVNAGARLELPVGKFYVALGASFLPLVTVHTVDQTGNATGAATALQPGDIFELRLDLSVGLRDTRGEHVATHDPNAVRFQY